MTRNDINGGGNNLTAISHLNSDSLVILDGGAPGFVMVKQSGVTHHII
jgi:hypothetical protein